jgi:cytidine deaminase
LLADGTVITGANIENASYGLCICAERVAVATAVVSGHKDFAAIAVVTDTNPPAAPCGACRQVLAEFAPDLQLILANTHGDVVHTTLSEIFPMQFSGADLRR